MTMPTRPLVVAFVVELDDELMAAQLAQHLGLGLEPRIVLGLQGDLEHLLLTLVVHQQRERRCALAEPLLNDQTVNEDIVRFRLGRVGDNALLGLGCGDLVLELLQLFEEVDDGVEPGGDLRVGAELDQVLERLRCPVEHGGDLQSLARLELLAELVESSRRRLAGEEVVGQGAERKDIRLLAGVAALRECLGRHVDRTRLLDEVGEVAGHRVAEAGDAAAGGLAGGCLPVEDLHVRGVRAPGRAPGCSVG